MKKNTPVPPRLFLRFFRWYCHPKLQDYIEGDLMEVYDARLKTIGKRKADLKFIGDIILLFRPGIIKPAEGHLNLTNYGMFKSFVKIGWRNLLRNKGYSTINISGLALGMTVATLIALWVYDEVSFNHYHSNFRNIAQIRSRNTDPNTGITRGSEAMQLPMGASLKMNYRHYFKHILMGFWFGNYTLISGDKKIQSKGEFIEPGVIDMLSLKMLQGTSSALSDPHSIILAKSKAEAIFGNEDPLNKTLKIDNRIDVTVTGVYDDLPNNTRFGEVQFFSSWDLWVSSNEWIKDAETNWNNNSFNVYVELQPNVPMNVAGSILRDFWLKNGPADFPEYARKYKAEVLLYPMSQWHLYSEFKDGLPAGGQITFVWLFGIVGIFVLLLACINFVNLTTARSEKRAKEVGVRKTIGSNKAHLIQQFIIESFLVVLLSFALSLLLASLFLPLFNMLTQKTLAIPFNEPGYWIISFAFVLLTGLLASVYPAFYLSSFQPVKVLKGIPRLGRFAALPRKILVVVQFTVSVVLIVGTTVVYQQIQYARNRPVGYTREGIITVPMNDPNYKGKCDVMKSELLNTAVVSEVAFSSSPLTQIWNNAGGYKWEGKDPELASDFSITSVTHDFGKLAGWQFIAGRDFSREHSADSSGIIINETAATYLGFKDPVGEVIRNGNESLEIIGVIKDMIMSSPYEPVQRGFFFLDYKNATVSQIDIKIKTGTGVTEALSKIENVFRKIVPSAAFDYQFVDQEYAKKFGEEERIGKLVSLFAALAILISCLGLFGLASFVTEQRTREIGVRRVMGASVASLWKMLSRDFVALVVISCIVTIPIAWYLMHQWLMQYQYHTEISWWVFLIAGAGALAITLLTVSYQSIRAAMANPVKSLRSE